MAANLTALVPNKLRRMLYEVLWWIQLLEAFGAAKLLRLQGSISHANGGKTTLLTGQLRRQSKNLARIRGLRFVATQSTPPNHATFSKPKLRGTKEMNAHYKDGIWKEVTASRG